MTADSKTCAERIAGHMEGRLEDFRAIAELQDHGRPLGDDDTFLGTRALEMAGETGAEDGVDTYEIGDDILDAYPLGVSRRTVFRVDLSTGGPADWLEVVCTGDTPVSEAGIGREAAFEIQRIVYHFSDWGDHAERELSGEDFDTAERFARSVVPELID